MSAREPARRNFLPAPLREPQLENRNDPARDVRGMVITNPAGPELLIESGRMGIRDDLHDLEAARPRAPHRVFHQRPPDPLPDLVGVHEKMFQLNEF